MKRLLLSLAVIAAIAAAGCTETLTSPGGEAIIGSWKASKIGAAFNSASTLDIEFKSDGSFNMVASGTSSSGTYSTGANSASSSIRDITINGSGMTLKGIYLISGNQMKLEVLPSPTPSGVTAPDAAVGIGSTLVGGATTTAYVTEMQKQ